MKIRKSELEKIIREALTESDKCKGKNPGLWCNIHKRRVAGKRPKRPGEKGYPKTLDIDEMGEYGMNEAGGEWYGLGRGPGRPGVLDRSKKKRGKKLSPEMALYRRFDHLEDLWDSMSENDRFALVQIAMERQVGLYSDEASRFAKICAEYDFLEGIKAGELDRDVLTAVADQVSDDTPEAWRS